MPAPRWVAKANKAGLNRLTRFVAPWAPGWAVVIHRGRKSGRTFRTPLWAFARRGGYVIALTYGSDADWVRNVMAAGGCEVRLDGHDYRGTHARLVTLADAGPVLETAYTRSQLRLMKKLGIQQVLYLDATPATSTNASANRRIP